MKMRKSASETSKALCKSKIDSAQNWAYGSERKRRCPKKEAPSEMTRGANFRVNFGKDDLVARFPPQARSHRISLSAGGALAVCIMIL